MDYSSSFTLRDTTCHEDVKYVFNLIPRLFSDWGIRLLCIFVLDCYTQKDLYIKPAITPENGLMLLLLDYAGLCYTVNLCFWNKEPLLRYGI